MVTESSDERCGLRRSMARADVYGEPCGIRLRRTYGRPGVCPVLPLRRGWDVRVQHAVRGSQVTQDHRRERSPEGLLSFPVLLRNRGKSATHRYVRRRRRELSRALRAGAMGIPAALARCRSTSICAPSVIANMTGIDVGTPRAPTAVATPISATRVRRRPPQPAPIVVQVARSQSSPPRTKSSMFARGSRRSRWKRVHSR
jgi:hypothetical protein